MIMVLKSKWQLYVQNATNPIQAERLWDRSIKCHFLTGKKTMKLYNGNTS